MLSIAMAPVDMVGPDKNNLSVNRFMYLGSSQKLQMVRCYES